MISFLTIIIWTAYLIGLFVIIFWLLVFFDESIEEEVKKLKKHPLVTVAIPAWNEEKVIEDTIDSVTKLDYPKNKIEIIVINDGSTDSTRKIVQDYIKKSSYNIKLINQKNKGKGAALNTALKKAKGQFFICLDADSIIRKDALKKMLPHFQDKKVAAVLPLMKIRKPENLLQKIQWCEYLINYFYKKLMAALNCIHVAPGPFSAYRKYVIKKLKGFDEKNITEDLEISLRLQKHHYKIIQLLTTEVYTIAPSTWKGFYRQRNRWYKGAVLNALKYKGMMFNKKYGDFGFIQMPRILIAGILGVTMLALILYRYLIKPLSRKIYNLSLMKFNIIPVIKNFIYNFKLLDLNFTNIFFAIIIFSLSMYILFHAHKHTKEPLSRYGYVTVPAYLLLYGILASIAWLGVTIDLIMGKKQKW